MGRLQKKKTISAKKKKKQKAEVTEPSRGKAGVAAQKTVTPAVSSTEGAKKPAIFQGKAQAKTRTEPGKIRTNIDKGLQFLREVKIELKKVTWPTRKQTISSTVVVIILVMIISLFLGVVDIGLSGLVRVVLQ
ncbi:MAG: preprotein translocase subunit SecE [Deltaproteobacteria bacterium]|nr:preprotein translocase subunit SecE [Deltaproteobacteria bacterium]